MSLTGSISQASVRVSCSRHFLISHLSPSLTVFHHDGPFDACAPSRNKHRNQAPLFAWGDDPTAAQLGGSAYPSAQAYAAFSNDFTDPPKKKVDALAEAWGIHEPEPFEDFSAGGGSGRLDGGDTPTNSIYNGKETHS